MRKKPNRKSNIIGPLGDDGYKNNPASNEFFHYAATRDEFQFRAGDRIICRRYRGGILAPNSLVIAQPKRGAKILTTAANASKIAAIVVAYQREVKNA